MKPKYFTRNAVAWSGRIMTPSSPYMCTDILHASLMLVTPILLWTLSHWVIEALNDSENYTILSMQHAGLLERRGQENCIWRTSWGLYFRTGLFAKVASVTLAFSSSLRFQNRSLDVLASESFLGASLSAGEIRDLPGGQEEC
jgi:hypothetical protein